MKSSWWEPVDSIILGFFLFEVFVRIRRQGGFRWPQRKCGSAGLGS